MDINNIPKEILDQIPPEFLDNLDQLMQETRKPVFGEKVIEEHLPALCRQAAHVPAGMIDYPTNKAGTIKAGAG